MPRSNAPDECVGSLLVHQQDMLELSTSTPVAREAVGTLLVSQRDMKELSTHEEIKTTVVNVVDESHQPVTLIRRITKTMTGPPPSDADSDLWAD